MTCRRQHVCKIIRVSFFKIAMFLIVSFCSTERETFPKLIPRNKASDNKDSSTDPASTTAIDNPIQYIEAFPLHTSYLKTGSSRIWDCEILCLQSPWSRSKALPATAKRAMGTRMICSLFECLFPSRNYLLVYIHLKPFDYNMI